MVLNLRRGWVAKICLVSAAMPIAPAVAQQIDRPNSVLDLPGDEYQPLGVRAGNFLITPAVDARLEYDDNIYAESTNTDDDVKAVITPQLTATLDRETYRISARAQATYRQFVDQKSENSEAAIVDAQLSWRPSATDSLTGSAGWQRVVEDRGDPEARNFQGSGPRLSDLYRADLGYARNAGRIGIDVRGAISRIEHVSALDTERDHNAYIGNVRLGYRVSGLISVIGQGFVNRRDFRLATDNSGVNRDATTYGARGGVAIDPGGVLRGDASVGIFRLNPGDPTLKSRSGFSAEASLTYQPMQRLAVIFNAFQGDVATVRAGAQARTDRRIQLGIQQEVRHNLRWLGGVGYRRTNFIGSSVKERTLVGFGEIEYLMSRNLAIAATARYADRTSSTQGEGFERFRGGLEIRLKY